MDIVLKMILALPTDSNTVLLLAKLWSNKKSYNSLSQLYYNILYLRMGGTKASSHQTRGSFATLQKVREKVAGQVHEEVLEKVPEQVPKQTRLQRRAWTAKRLFQWRFLLLGTFLGLMPLIQLHPLPRDIETQNHRDIETR